MISKSKLILSGNLKDGDGKTIFKSIIKDGPYAELKESITGFFIIREENLENASLIANKCPFVARGGSVEVRIIPELEFEEVCKSIIGEKSE